MREFGFMTSYRLENRQWEECMLYFLLTHFFLSPIGCLSCDNTTPMHVSLASVSTFNCLVKSGKASIRADTSVCFRC